MEKYCAINIQPMSSSTDTKRFLIFYEGKYYECGSMLVKLVKELQSCKTMDEAIHDFIIHSNNAYTYETVINIVQKKIDPIFNEKEKKHSFLYEKDLIDAKQISWFSNHFSVLFNAFCMISIFLFTVVLDIRFFWVTENLLEYNTKLNLYGILGLCFFLLFSSFFHELGHASACRFFGLNHGKIGFGLYLNFPVLYTDVTEVWKLNRKQRIIVNIAGVYFQCYLLLILLIIFILYPTDIIRYIILFINFGFLMTLNPFFRFDGYWLASDILGVPNLRIRSQELLKYYISKMKGKAPAFQPYMLKIRKLERIGFCIYAVTMNTFILFYFLYVIPKFIYHFMKTFPGEINELILYLSNRITPPFSLLHNMTAKIIFIGLLFYLLYNLVSPLIRRYIATHGKVYEKQEY